VACVLVHIEADGDRPTQSALAALGEGRRIASTLGAALYATAVIPAPDTRERKSRRGSTGGASARRAAATSIERAQHGREELARAIGQGGADKVVLVSAEGARGPVLWSTSGAALTAACEQLRPALVLFAATSGGSDIAPRLAARLGAAFVADAVIETGPRGEVLFCRGVYGGGFQRRLALDDLERAAVVTVPTGRAPARGGDDAEVMVLDGAGARDRRVVHLGDSLSEGAGLEQARVVVTGGAGVSAASWPLIAALARALGGEVAATRSACARGLAPPDREVGVGARRVAPLLYVSVGASGSPAHLAGVCPDAEIVAIDRDPDAPIFRVASYGLVGTVEDMVPRLIATLEARDAPGDA
jgi:electron transfer flavoprotein alpha subunit